MDFRLIYEGPLLGQNSGSAHKWQIRRALQPQLRALWQEEPLRHMLDDFSRDQPEPGRISSIRKRSGIRFLPLVTEELKIYAEISILLFRPGPRGALLGPNGDADNRLKTLLDALRMPSAKQEITTEIAGTLAEPFQCLLEDDALVSKVSMETDQLLAATESADVKAIIEVVIKKSSAIFANMAF